MNTFFLIENLSLEEENRLHDGSIHVQRSQVGTHFQHVLFCDIVSVIKMQ